MMMYLDDLFRKLEDKLQSGVGRRASRRRVARHDRHRRLLTHHELRGNYVAVPAGRWWRTTQLAQCGQLLRAVVDRLDHVFVAIVSETQLHTIPAFLQTADVRCEWHRDWRLTEDAGSLTKLIPRRMIFFSLSFAVSSAVHSYRCRDIVASACEVRASGRTRARVEAGVRPCEDCQGKKVNSVRMQKRSSNRSFIRVVQRWPRSTAAASRGNVVCG
jgi:hypothetical protein